MYADLLLFCNDSWQMTQNMHMSWQKVWRWLILCDWTPHLKTPLAEYGPWRKTRANTFPFISCHWGKDLTIEYPVHQEGQELQLSVSGLDLKDGVWEICLKMLNYSWYSSLKILFIYNPTTFLLYVEHGVKMSTRRMEKSVLKIQRDLTRTTLLTVQVWDTQVYWVKCED